MLNIISLLEKPDCKFLAQLFLHHELIRSHPVKAFHGSIVDLKFNLLKFPIGQSAEVSFLWQILSEYSNAIFICTALVGRVRVTEVDLYVQFFSHRIWSENS